MQKERLGKMYCDEIMSIN